MLRVVMFAPHYAEYSTRLAMEMAGQAKVLLIVDATNRRNEVEEPLWRAARAVLDLHEFRTDNRFWRRASRLTVALRILRFRPDVLHIQEQPDKLTATVVRAVRRWLPICLTVHDPKPHTGRDAAYAARWDKFRRLIRSSAGVYHVHGAFCGTQMRQAMALAHTERPVVETLHGVILTPLPEQRRAPERRRILLFGRMEEYKGIAILLGAARALAAKGVEFELVLAGRGPELDRLRGEITGAPYLRLIEHYLTPSEAIEEFQRASVVVIPYLEATQSGVVAAAFGNGRPVVASRVGGLIDTVQDEANGLLVPPGSVPHLADALERVLSDDAVLERLTQGAERTGRTELSWAAVCATLGAAYRRLSEAGQAGSAS